MQRGEFLSLAVSELVSFAAAVSGFTGVTDSGSSDKSFSKKKKIPHVKRKCSKITTARFEPIFNACKGDFFKSCSYCIKKTIKKKKKMLLL